MFNKKKNDEEIIVKSKPTTDEEIITEEILNNIPQETEQTQKKGKEKKVIKWGPNRVLQCFAYFAVALIALVMILRLIFKDNQNTDIITYLQGISEVLAYIVCIWLGFYFTRKRGSIWWLVGWVVASVILIIFYIFAVV